MRIVFSIIFSFVLLCNTAFAVPIPDANDFLSAGINNPGDLNTKNLVDDVDIGLGPGLVTILKVLYLVAVGVAVCVFAFMGIQLLLASPQQKAQLKSGLVSYSVGLLLFIAGVPIAILIINILITIF